MSRRGLLLILGLSVLSGNAAFPVLALLPGAALGSALTGTAALPALLSSYASRYASSPLPLDRRNNIPTPYLNHRANQAAQNKPTHTTGSQSSSQSQSGSATPTYVTYPGYASYSYPAQHVPYAPYVGYLQPFAYNALGAPYAYGAFSPGFFGYGGLYNLAAYNRGVYHDPAYAGTASRPVELGFYGGRSTDQQPIKDSSSTSQSPGTYTQAFIGSSTGTGFYRQ